VEGGRVCIECIYHSGGKGQTKTEEKPPELYGTGGANPASHMAAWPGVNVGLDILVQRGLNCLTGGDK